MIKNKNKIGRIENYNLHEFKSFVKFKQNLKKLKIF